VSRPHSIEPPSSTDQSKGASPNSLSFLRTQLISDSPCEAVRTITSVDYDGCSGEATAGQVSTSRGNFQRALHFCIGPPENAAQVMGGAATRRHRVMLRSRDRSPSWIGGEFLILITSPGRTRQPGLFLCPRRPSTALLFASECAMMLAQPIVSRMGSAALS
jgi:hypothetical protein